MRNKIFGGIGILWGGAIVLRWLVTDTSAAGNAAYQTGQSGAVLFGVLMFAAGLYAFFKKSS